MNLTIREVYHHALHDAEYKVRVARCLRDPGMCVRYSVILHWISCRLARLT